MGVKNMAFGMDGAFEPFRTLKSRSMQKVIGFLNGRLQPAVFFIIFIYSFILPLASGMASAIDRLLLDLLSSDEEEEDLEAQSNSITLPAAPAKQSYGGSIKPIAKCQAPSHPLSSQQL